MSRAVCQLAFHQHPDLAPVWHRSFLSCHARGQRCMSQLQLLCHIQAPEMAHCVQGHGNGASKSAASHPSPQPHCTPSGAAHVGSAAGTKFTANESDSHMLNGATPTGMLTSKKNLIPVSLSSRPPSTCLGGGGDGQPSARQTLASATPACMKSLPFGESCTSEDAARMLGWNTVTPAGAPCQAH